MSRQFAKAEPFSTLIIEDETLDFGGYAQGPERNLMSALLFDGVQSYLAHSLSGGGAAARTKYLEAHHWVHTKDPEYIFSFDNVCEALGIDPDGLRLGLQNFVHSNQLEPTREPYRRARRHG